MRHQRAAATHRTCDGASVTMPVETGSRQSVWPWVGLAVIVVGSSAWAPTMVAGSTSVIQVVGQLGWLALAPLFAALAVVIMSRQPGNRVGWLLLFAGAGLALDTIIGGTLLSLSSPPAEMTPLLFLRLWINNWSWIAAFFPIFLLLYLFPTGQLPTPRWVWAPRLVAAMALVMLFSAAFTSDLGPIDEAWFMPNPIGFIGRDAIDVIFMPWLASLLAVALGGWGR